MNFKIAPRLFFLFLLFFTYAEPAFSQLSNGFTFSRSHGLSTNSAASSVTLSSSRVLGDGCKSQVQKIYRQNNVSNWKDQGCITEPENVIALPSQPGQLDQFEIIDKTRKFGVADRSVSSISESVNLQKSMTGFNNFGYSVFVEPQR